MNRILWAVVFAAAGVVTCIALQMTAAALSLTPRFPAFAGEDDFNLRLQYFLLIVCPAFAILGAWIGTAYRRSYRTIGYMWLGLLIGSIAALLTARLLGQAIGDLSTRVAANRAVRLMFIGWILLATLGALVAARVGRPHTSE